MLITINSHPRLAFLKKAHLHQLAFDQIDITEQDAHQRLMSHVKFALPELTDVEQNQLHSDAVQMLNRVKKLHVHRF